MSLELLAPLLDYPTADWHGRVMVARDAIEDAGLPDVLPHLDRFRDAMALLSPAGREARHAATFDLSRQCVPYVSIHLFGEENFKRGALMAALNARFAMIGFTTKGELPDHLAVLLRFAGVLEDGAEKSELALHLLVGPVGAMTTSLPATNPYRDLLAAIQATLSALFPVEVAAARSSSTAVTGACRSTDGASCCHAPLEAEARHA